MSYERIARERVELLAKVASLTEENEQLRGLDEHAEWERAEIWRAKANDLAAQLSSLTEENERRAAILKLATDQVEWLQRTKAEAEQRAARYEEALKQIATKERYGCCNPMYPDSPVCAHNIARHALSPIDPPLAQQGEPK
jgi:chromosome segregation ATPase